MIWRTEILNPSVLQFAAFSSGTASILTSWSVAIFGVPLPVLLAAFAGALVSLSFLPAMTCGRAAITVLGSTLAAAYLEPLVQHAADLPDKVALAVAFASALVAQPFITWMLAGAPGALDKVKEWVRR